MNEEIQGTVDSVMNTDVMGTPLRDLLTFEFLAGIAGSILGAIAILIIGFWLAGMVQKRVRRIGERNEQLDATLFNFLGSLARYAVLAFTFIFVLNTFGVQTTSIVAAVGAVGLAIGLALQGTLSNVAAGVMLIFFRPIKGGDFVEIGGQTGIVKEITLNYTELATLDNVQVIIPNAQVWGNTIVNFSAHDTRRAEWVFGVGYGANLAEAERIIRDTILADERVLDDPEPWLQVTTLGESSVDFTMRVWCNSADLWGLKTDMTRKVKEALDAGGIDIPFPTRTVMSVPAA